MNNKKPIYVRAHVRNKNIKPEKSGDIVAILMVGSVIVTFLAVYWKLTLTLSGVISLVVFAKKYYQFINNPQRLVINDWQATVTDRIWDNIKGMLREQLNA